MDDRVAWGVLAALLVVAEVLGLELWGAMLAVGALGGLLAASLGASGPVEVVVAALVGGLMVGAVRPVAARHLAVRSRPNDPAAALEGVTASVVVEVSDSTGQVRVHGELWTARPALPGTVLSSGSTVWIGAVSGATLLVHPHDQPSLEKP
ncbi:MAG: hypothetical protein JWO60_77 [Frankiales bacterium]|nr:hypothetical protein [Frankiales bacterium]